MTMPFYVAPEQLMKDRADFAQKGIARGRSLVARLYADGIIIVAENPSRNLRKISEIYDRIAFAGVGRYNEYDQLRIAGIRHADMKGYQYSREDVDPQALANQYAQMLGQIFTHDTKPLEVEIVVASVGKDREGDRLFHIRYDGSVSDEDEFAVLGGEAETIIERVADGFNIEDDESAALSSCVSAIAGDRELGVEELEVGLLRRGEDGRLFERLENSAIQTLMNGS